MQGNFGNPRFANQSYSPPSSRPAAHHQQAQYQQAQYQQPAYAQHGGPGHVSPHHPMYTVPQPQRYAVPSYTPHPFSSHAPQPAGWQGEVGFPRMAMSAGLRSIPRGLPSAFGFAGAIVAVGLALLCDLIFLRVHIPGVGGYAWYLTTALSFLGAGYGAARWTRARRSTAMIAIVLSGIMYGAGDLALGYVLEALTMNGAIVLGAQGVAIALFTGFSGVYKGLNARANDG